MKNPAQSLIDAFVNKLAGFVVKDNDNNTRFDLQVTSSLFNAKTNMVEVYFGLPEAFVKYVPEHIGETKPVTVDLILSDGQERIMHSLLIKKDKAIKMFEKLSKHSNSDFIVKNKEFDKELIKPSFL